MKNTMKSTMKTSPFALALLAVAIACGSVTSPQVRAQTVLSDDIQRELSIMENIFSAATNNKSERGNRMGPPETLYLPGQGMLFIFNLPGANWFSFNYNPGNFSIHTNGNFDFDFDGDDDAAPAAPATPASPAVPAAPKGRNNAAISAAEQYRDKVQDLNDEMRDKQSDMRDLQRKMRDLQRAQRSDPGKNNQAEMDKVGKSMEKLGDEMSKLGDSIAQAQKDFEQQRNAATESRNKENIARIFDTLCKYGKTLQSLNNGEHVNLILRNGVAGGKTRLYVLDASAVKNCSAPDALLKQAKSYSM
ncbi:MAG TPA: hypothetical protein VMH83_05410 [Candidatus Acidoferrum sp.]|nr:hypothetical protein [Candidatus Acidoferrum sp.]